MKAPDMAKENNFVLREAVKAAQMGYYDHLAAGDKGDPAEERWIETLTAGADAITKVAALESRLAQVERERDWLRERKLFLTHSLEEVEKERRAIKNDMENYCHHGSICKHFCEGTCPYPVEGCPLYPSDCEAYEWRGVCEENTKED